MTTESTTELDDFFAQAFANAAKYNMLQKQGGRFDADDFFHTLLLSFPEEEGGRDWRDMGNNRRELTRDLLANPQKFVDMFERIWEYTNGWGLIDAPFSRMRCTEFQIESAQNHVKGIFGHFAKRTTNAKVHDKIFENWLDLRCDL